MKFFHGSKSIDSFTMTLQELKTPLITTKTDCDDSVAETVSTSEESSCSSDEEKEEKTSILNEVLNDFDSSKGGDNKILRAIGRTALVNAVVTATTLTGGATAGVGYLAGGAITAKRFGDGVEKDDHKECVKSLAVFGSATSASMIGQVVTGAVLVGAVGVSLPVAAPIAFCAGCCSGITAGALSEWGVDSVLKEEEKNRLDDDKINQHTDTLDQGALLEEALNRSRARRKLDIPAFVKKTFHERNGEETTSLKEAFRKWRRSHGSTPEPLDSLNSPTSSSMVA